MHRGSIASNAIHRDRRGDGQVRELLDSTDTQNPNDICMAQMLLPMAR